MKDNVNINITTRRFPVDGSAPISMSERPDAKRAEALLGPVHEVPLGGGALVFFQRESKVVNEAVSFAVMRMIGHPIRIMGDAIIVPPLAPPPL